MTQLSRERLEELANRQNVGAILGDEIAEMARELLALRKEREAAVPVYQYRIRNGYNGQVTEWQTIRRDQVDFVLKAQPHNAEFQIIAAPQPVAVPCPYPCGWDNLNKYAIQDAAFVARGLVEGEVVTEGQRQAVIKNNDRLLKIIAACRAAMLQPSSGALQLPQWIPCSERMPESNPGSHEYLVYETLNNRVQHDYWNTPDTDYIEPLLSSWNHYGNYVTHWMPLPAAPQEPTDDERIMEIEGIVAVPDGYRLCLIPMEHTEAFHAACTAAFNEFERGTGPCGVFIAGHRAMLSAAPQEPTK